jgi:DNA-binding transcriptional MerR regulator
MKRKISNAGLWRIGELAKNTGVSTDTLRHYERNEIGRKET